LAKLRGDQLGPRDANAAKDAAIFSVSLEHVSERTTHAALCRASLSTRTCQLRVAYIYAQMALLLLAGLRPVALPLEPAASLGKIQHDAIPRIFIALQGERT